MIILNWSKFPDADVQSYRIYRSIIGFTAPLIDYTGNQFTVKINGGASQVINLTGPQTVDIINNKVKCARAFTSYDNTRFLFRNNVRQAPGTVQLVSTSIVGSDFTPRLISEKSETELIATVVDIPTQAVMSYTDYDGVPEDFYSISTIDSNGNESAKSPLRQAVTTTGNICVIEGLIVNAQGVRMSDVEVIAYIQIPPEKHCSNLSVTQEPVKTISGPDGRFSLPLLQGLLVRLEIPDVGYGRMVTVPNKPYVFLNDLPVDEEYRYPRGYQAT